MGNIEAQSPYIRIYNKFEWDVVISTLLKYDYEWTNSTPDKLKEYSDGYDIYCIFNTKNKQVEISNSSSFAGYPRVDMKQFLYKFNLLDKAIDNPKFKEYDLVNNEGVLSQSECKLVESLTRIIQAVDIDKDELDFLYDEDFISTNEWQSTHYDISSVQELLYEINKGGWHPRTYKVIYKYTQGERKWKNNL